jgi:pyruvate formate lyase activating enzyme
MRDVPPTPRETLIRARRIAIRNGVRYAFTGNIHDSVGQATYCHDCQAVLVGRDGYEITDWHLTADGRCDKCGTTCAGVFTSLPGTWGPRRVPVQMSAASGPPMA